MQNNMYTLRCLSSMHCGIGQGLKDIDLPTARNKVSGHPMAPGSSLKGVLKTEYLHNGLAEKTQLKDLKTKIDALFGTDNGDFSSAIALGDANLLALPVRSFFGTFAYMASPYSLQKITMLYAQSKRPTQLPKIPNLGLDNNRYQILLTDNSVLKQIQNPRVLLEEMDLIIIDGDDNAQQWADIIAPLYFNDAQGQALFKKRFAIVDDNVLSFLCDTSLPVDTRIAIDNTTGAVQAGALWYEETVPAETLLLGMVGVDRAYNASSITSEELNKLLTEVGTIYCQIGGKATTGKGFVAINFNPGAV